MKVSLNIANQYSNVDLVSIPTEVMLSKIGEQLGAVEDVVDWGPRFASIVIAKVVKCVQHEGADKLNVCLVDDAGITKDVDRNADGLVQVVCGAPNVREGLLVAWLPPGSTVPSTFDKDPFVLGSRELRGVVSNGMLASASELGISDDHEGILEIDIEAKPGTSFASLYDMNDVVIDLENKMFTHRPDCFGIIGVARELAGINGQQFISPEWYHLSAVRKGNIAGTLAITSSNNIPEKVRRFMVQVVENVTLKPSPISMQADLTRLGSRPINNIVDATNFYMHLTAQPTHAFDYDKVKALSGGSVNIFPRMALEGEKLELLNGKTVTLTENDIVIATDKQAIALGGVMGGAATEVDANTKNIIVECANFDMYTIRRTSMRHGIFSDAVTRFNKGQSHLQNPVVLQKLVDEICSLSGARAGVLYDSAPEEDGFTKPPVDLNSEFINARLGTNLSAEQIKNLLELTECQTNVIENNISVTPPFWRTDLEIAEDIVEEVGRLYGFDKLPVVLPERSSAPVGKNAQLELNTKIRRLLSKGGANEVVTYSFVPGKLIDDAGQNKDEAYELSNAISPELQYYRLTLTPSLLSRVYGNIRAKHESFAIFEIGKTHLKLQGVNDEGLPLENSMLSFVFSTDDKYINETSGAAYYQVKRYLELISEMFGLSLDYQVLTDDLKYEITKPFQPGRAALVTDKNSGNYMGVIGEYKANIRKKLKLPEHTAGFEIMLDPLLTSKASYGYRPLGKYPGLSQDITFATPLGTTYADLKLSLQESIDLKIAKSSYQYSLKTISIYHKDKAKNKSVSFRLHLSHPDRTLTTEESNNLVDAIVKDVETNLGVKRS